MRSDITTSAAYQAAEAYERFIVRSIFRYWTPLLLERAAPRPSERVLDVACGTGVVARTMVPLVGPAGKVVGLDINPAMLEVACRQFSDHCTEIEWREGRAEKLPLPDDEFDLVTCQQGLQFFEDRGMAAREMRRVLRPDGRVTIAVWQPLDQHPFYEAFFGAMASELGADITSISAPFAFGDPDVLRQLLLDAGFGQVRVESVQHPVYYEDPPGFVELMFKSAAAVIPAFAELSGPSMESLRTRFSKRISGLLEAYTVAGNLTFPLYANIATATC